MSPHKKIRFGFIGFGAFAERSVLPSMRNIDNVEIVALQKRSIAEAEARAKANNIRLAFSSVDELVAHPDVDAVFIGSANAVHCSETLAAARAGKHVIVEKPMAMNAREGEQMIEACRNAGVRLMVGHLTRFSPLLRNIRSTIQSGELGNITYARADFIYNGSISPRKWLHDRVVAGGGPVFDIGVHCLDSLRFILDDEVVAVSSVLSPPPTESQTEESAMIGLRFSKGTVGAIFCSFCAPGRRKQLEIIGTKGIITAGDFTSSNHTGVVTTAFGSDTEPGEIRSETITVPNLVTEEVRYFCDAILHDRPLEIPGENGLANQRVLDAVFSSTAGGGRL
jgi:1,5-anhydro-D-fructose reductase (1,5-anhydro-D-mannitol-forming)